MTPHRAVIAETNEPVVVLEYDGEHDSFLLVYGDGRYGPQSRVALRCVEPGFVGAPAPEQHEHVLGPAAPILEGVRVKGTRRSCTVAGCAYVEDTEPRRTGR